MTSAKKATRALVLFVGKTAPQIILIYLAQPVRSQHPMVEEWETGVKAIVKNTMEAERRTPATSGVFSGIQNVRTDSMHLHAASALLNVQMECQTSDYSAQRNLMDVAWARCSNVLLI